MADEVTVIETQEPRHNNTGPVMKVPPLTTQSIDIAGAASAAFQRGTTMVWINSTTACKLEFGADPDGNGDLIPIAASTLVPFDVQAGHKVIAVAAA
jgi:hypothetical protein